MIEGKKEFLDGGADELTLPNFYCPTCSRVFHYQAALDQHFKKKHKPVETIVWVGPWNVEPTKSEPDR